MCAMLPFATVIEIDNFILRYNAFILRKFFFSFLFHFILFIFFISSYRKKKTEKNPNKYMCFPLVLSISRQTTFFCRQRFAVEAEKKARTSECRSFLFAPHIFPTFCHFFCLSLYCILCCCCLWGILCHR